MESVPRAIATGSMRVVAMATILATNRSLSLAVLISGTHLPATDLQVFLLDRCEMLVSMWNDTDVPLAYLITFRSYGTWLHGDERGSIDRFRNRYKSPYINPNPDWHRHNTHSLEREPVILDDAQRQSVERAIRTTCDFRSWHLHAVNVRTNHAHIVVCIGSSKPERALTAFKANATRQMREDGCWKDDSSPWAERGSKRYLWNERSVARAVDYVLNGQGDELPAFDD
jgi:REP element-mobilizing transposase RayT